MPHNCKALILHCIDFRLGRALKEYLEKNELLGDCDILSVAGGVRGLTYPEEPSDRTFIFRQINISMRLHKIQGIVLINHTDCGAYGGGEKFAFADEERKFHLQELREARAIILEKYPRIIIKMVLAKIEPSGKVSFEEITG